jgi:DNA mismatch repair protein MutS2
MNPGALRALEFDTIVRMVANLAVTPTGRTRLASLRPATDPAAVVAAQRATSEGVRFLADHTGFPLRAPTDLEDLLAALAVEGRPLEPPRLLALADYLESIEATRQGIRSAGAAFPVLGSLVEAVASFGREIADVRSRIEPSGEVADDASPALASIRDRLRRQKARLRATLEAYVRGRETSKYLQDQVITDRNGRYVLVVRAEHRSAIPGIVHGGSASGASLFIEPLETVEINNEIVALQEQEGEEVHRILLALTDAFRRRPDDLRRTVDIATELDVIQARARCSLKVGGVEPVIVSDGTFELRGARHPLLINRIGSDFSKIVNPESDAPPRFPVPVDIRLAPPIRVLVITGPNTGGKTVALKTAGLLAAMAQSGLHVPAEPGSRLPVFKSLFADIGDEQSISASLSTFSAHITNVVAMDRDLALPALVLLDEVGAGTDPVEGAALGTAIIDHFRRRGAHLIATTHSDALKAYASTTEGVVGAAFGFDPDTFAPTYQLRYGSPGRSLAIEIAARLGMPPAVIAAARENLSAREQQLADHLARVDEALQRLEQERRAVAHERDRLAESERAIRAREDALRAREEALRRRLDARLEDQLREARRQIDGVIERLKARAAELSEQAAVRLRTGDRVRTAGVSTGDLGALRSEARLALAAITAGGAQEAAPPASAPLPEAIAPGTRVVVGAVGLEGVVVDVHGKHAEVDIRGKRLRAPLRDLRAAGGSRPAPSVKVRVDLQPREGSLSALNVIGCTVDEALARLERFIDQTMVADVREVRIVHGHGTGQLRRAIAAALKDHPLVERFAAAPPEQGGGGVTIVTLRE